MGLTNFDSHLQSEIQNKPFENLSSIVLEDGTYYYSPLGSNANGTYEWNSLDDPSFSIVSLDGLSQNDEFMVKLIDAAVDNQIAFKERNVEQILRDLLDETLGFGLPFTLLDPSAFTKELEYYNAKRKV